MTSAAVRRPGPRMAVGGLAASGVISFVGAVLAAVLGFALTVVIGRALGAAGSGLFFSVAAVFFILSNTLELGADTGLVWALPRLRALGRGSELRSTVRLALRPVWVVSVLSAGALFLLAPQLADVLVEPAQQDRAVLLLRVVAPFLAVAAPLAVALAGTRGLGSVVPFTAIGNVGIPLARPLLVLGVVAAGLGSAAVMAAWALPVLVGAVAAFAVLGRQLRRAEAAPDPQGAPARPVAEQSTEFWRFSVPRGFSAVLEIALVWTDVLLVTALSSTQQAGIYAAASRFITTGTLVESALRVALGPRLSQQLALGDRRGAGRLNESAGLCIVALSWPVYLPLAVFSPVVLELFGAEFVAGSTALTVLALAMAVRMLAGLSQSVLLMSGHSGWQLANKVVALTVNVVLNLLLVPRYGLEGAAVAWSAALLIDALAGLLQVRLLVGLHLPLRRLATVTVLAGVCFGLGGVLARSVQGATVAGLATYLVLASAVYAAALWSLREQLGLTALLPSRSAS